MIIYRVACWLEGVINTIRFGVPMGGHDWVNEEEDIDALVTTSRCETCGKYQVLWERK